jgi:hypothetical protein
MNKNSPTPEKSPFERFSEAARHAFNLPKSDVKKIQAKTPPPKKTTKRK